MEEVMQQTVNNRKKALVKALILVAFIVGAILLVRLTPLKQYLTPDALGRYLDMTGFWGPVIFILIYAVGICLFLPGTLLTGLGAAIFGAYWGFVWISIQLAFNRDNHRSNNCQPGWITNWIGFLQIQE